MWIFQGKNPKCSLQICILDKDCAVKSEGILLLLNCVLLDCFSKPTVWMIRRHSWHGLAREVHVKWLTWRLSSSRHFQCHTFPPCDIIAVKLGLCLAPFSCRCGSLKLHSMVPCHISSVFFLCFLQSLTACGV